MSSLSEQNDLDGVAIIGMSGRFPGASNVQQFWENLKNGEESITYFSKEDAQKCGVDEESLKDPRYVLAGGLLDDIEMFDADFFGMNPREADNMDPQQRQFLECSYEALEDAGYSCNEYPYPVGVYAGSNMSYYFLYNLFNKSGVADDFSMVLGNDKDYISTRVSYTFNFKGPSINVQTACSTSMTAIAMAYEGLLNYQCDLALAGGTGIKLPQKSGYLFHEGFIASPDGHTRPFDEEAYGTVFTSTVGVLILKRLEDAVRDRDHIYAVIKGLAVNNDGSDKVGFTAPSREGQADVISAAQQLAGIEPEDVSYIEAHGTGTSLGDPIEISALEKVFQRNTKKKMFCAVGSVKGNVGHAISGSGAAGMIKTVLALHHKEIPPTINFREPNSKINFINSPFYVNNRLSAWESNGKPRIAGVSSFGFGGTNVHAVLGEAPEHKPAPQHNNTVSLLTLSARTPGTLDKMAYNLADYLQKNPNLSLNDVSYTLQVGRKEFEHRRCYLCRDLREAVDKLSGGEKGILVSGRASENSMNRQEVRQALKNPAWDSEQKLTWLAENWVQGAEVDWAEFYQDMPRCRVSLPTYPFERKKHWIEPAQLDRKPNSPEKKGATSKDPMDWLYYPSWKRTPLLSFQQEQLKKADEWIVFVDDTGFGDRLVTYLKTLGVEPTVIRASDSFNSIDPKEFKIDPENKEHYQRLAASVFAQTGKKKQILYLWGVTEDTAPISRMDSATQFQNKVFCSLLYLVQALGETSAEDKLRIAVVTNNMQSIDLKSAARPEKSVVLGPCKVIPREYGNIVCQSIDLTLPSADSFYERQVMDGLLAESVSDAPAFITAIRGPHRWVQEFEKWAFAERHALPFAQEGGTYLLTGGLGGIGCEIAEYMARQSKLRLAITQRSYFPEKGVWSEWIERHGEEDPVSLKIRKIQSIEQAGSEVRVLCADVTDLEEMKKAVLEVEQAWGHIRGVIHAAGIVDNGPVAEKTKETALKVMAPKVLGTLVLDEVFKERNLDYMVLFSSSSAVLGNAGFIDYCAANTFLDHYAQSQGSLATHYTVAINWDEWDGVGMAADAQGGNRIREKIPVQRGLQLLDSIVQSASLPQVIVSPGDFQEMLENVQSYLYAALNGRSLHNEEAIESNRPDLETPYLPPSSDTEKVIADIWQKLLGVYPIGIQDNFFELGGHSLLATSLVAELAKAFRCNISLQSLFERATIQELAEMFDVKHNISAKNNDNCEDEDFEEGSL